MSRDLRECIAASELDIERLATESPVGASCAFSIGGRPAVHVFVTADAEVAARFAKCAVAGAMRPRARQTDVFSSPEPQGDGARPALKRAGK